MCPELQTFPLMQSSGQKFQFVQYFGLWPNVQSLSHSISLACTLCLLLISKCQHAHTEVRRWTHTPRTSAYCHSEHDGMPTLAFSSNKTVPISPFLLFSFWRLKLSWYLLRWFIVLQLTLTTLFLYLIWLMSSSNKRLHILAGCLFALRFCSFLRMHSPLVGVEFYKLVLSDLQVLDSQGRPVVECN